METANKILELVTYIIEANPNFSIVVVIFLSIGVVLLFGVVTPGETEKNTDKRILWIKWSLLFSAIFISPFFFATSVTAAVMGWVRPSEKNWKYALAIVGLIYAITR